MTAGFELVGGIGLLTQVSMQCSEPLLEERFELSRRYLTQLIEHLGSDVLLRHEEDIPRQFLPIVRGEQDDHDAESGESGEEP